jgi:hypothetical protein
MRIQPMQVAAVAATRVTSCRRRRHGRQDRRTYRGGFASSLVPAGTAGCLPRCERSRARSTHGRPRSRSPAAASRREQASEVVHRDGPRRRAMAGDRSSQRRTRRCRAAPPPSAPALERLGGEVRLRQDQPPVVPAVHDDIAQGAVLDPAPLALDDDHVVQPEESKTPAASRRRGCSRGLGGQAGGHARDAGGGEQTGADRAGGRERRQRGPDGDPASTATVTRRTTATWLRPPRTQPARRTPTAPNLRQFWGIADPRTIRAELLRRRAGVTTPEFYDLGRARPRSGEDYAIKGCRPARRGRA